MATFGPAEKKITAKLEKLRKENPEEVEEILKTVIPPSNRNPPNRSQWRKVELAMKFINKSKAHRRGGAVGLTCALWALRLPALWTDVRKPRRRARA